MRASHDAARASYASISFLMAEPADVGLTPCARFPLLRRDKMDRIYRLLTRVRLFDTPSPMMVVDFFAFFCEGERTIRRRRSASSDFNELAYRYHVAFGSIHAPDFAPDEYAARRDGRTPAFHRLITPGDFTPLIRASQQQS